MANRLMRWFTWDHLNEDLRTVSKQCYQLAMWVDENLPESAEKTAGLRKLLEAKDAFVRAKVESLDEKESA